MENDFVTNSFDKQAPVNASIEAGDKQACCNSLTHSKRKGWLAVGSAIIFCPCHLPLLILALSGTAAGALLANHRFLAGVILVLVFVPSLIIAYRQLSAPNQQKP